MQILEKNYLLNVRSNTRPKSLSTIPAHSVIPNTSLSMYVVALTVTVVGVTAIVAGKLIVLVTPLRVKSPVISAPLAVAVTAVITNFASGLLATAKNPSLRCQTNLSFISHAGRSEFVIVFISIVILPPISLPSTTIAAH